MIKAKSEEFLGRLHDLWPVHNQTILVCFGVVDCVLPNKTQACLKEMPTYIGGI